MGPGPEVITRYPATPSQPPPYTFYHSQYRRPTHEALTPQDNLISLRVRDTIVEYPTISSHRSTKSSPNTTYSAYYRPDHRTATYRLAQVADTNNTTTTTTTATTATTVPPHNSDSATAVTPAPVAAPVAAAATVTGANTVTATETIVNNRTTVDTATVAAASAAATPTAPTTPAAHTPVAAAAAAVAAAAAAAAAAASSTVAAQSLEHIPHTTSRSGTISASRHLSRDLPASHGFSLHASSSPGSPANHCNPNLQHHQHHQPGQHRQSHQHHPHQHHHQHQHHHHHHHHQHHTIDNIASENWFRQRDMMTLDTSSSPSQQRASSRDPTGIGARQQVRAATPSASPTPVPLHHSLPNESLAHQSNLVNSRLCFPSPPFHAQVCHTYSPREQVEHSHSYSGSHGHAQRERGSVRHYMHYDNGNNDVEQVEAQGIGSSSSALTPLGTIQSPSDDMMMGSRSGGGIGRARCKRPNSVNTSAVHASLEEFARMAANVGTHGKALQANNAKSSTAGRKCTNCGNMQTRQWVRGEGQAWLCHSCGQFWRKNGYPRPRTLWNRPTFKRSSRKLRLDGNKSPEDRKKKARSFKAKKETVSSNFLNGKRLVECEGRLTPVMGPGRSNSAGRAVVLGTRTLMVGGPIGGSQGGIVGMGSNVDAVGTGDGNTRSGNEHCASMLGREDGAIGQAQAQAQSGGDMLKSELVEGFQINGDQDQHANPEAAATGFHEAMSWDGSYTRSVDNSRLPSTSSLAHSARVDMDTDGGGGGGNRGGCGG